MHPVDWAIVLGLLLFVLGSAIASQRYMRSVADFLVANRCAGRYLLSISGGMSGLGAITMVGLFEMYYTAGYSALWWSLMSGPVLAIIGLSGWVIYRYRETRALTLGQFFEMRYSGSFRIFAGILCFVSGIINFGIFPAVGARFFLYFCGMPATFPIFGIQVSTFASLMIFLLAVSYYLAVSGGQIAVIVTDFLQGAFTNLVFVALLIFVFTAFRWSQLVEALQTAPPDSSLLHPFHTRDAKDFNVWYFLIGAFGTIYTWMSWQGQQAYNASASNPHEARMAGIIVTWRTIALNLLVVVLPLCAYTVLHHPDFVVLAQQAHAATDGITNPQIQKQMIVPIALRQILPTGLMGAFAAIMLAAFIGNHDTYLHSWGSIFIQDVIMPLRRKPLTPTQHIRLLRWSIFGVAVFIFFFSLLFRQTEYIYMFFAITGAIFTGGAGSAILGGLYWKRGTTAAAWASMLTGSTLAVAGIVIRQIDPAFPINGMVMSFIAMACSIVVYVAVSLLGRRVDFDMDRLLHRGSYARAEDTAAGDDMPVRGLRRWLGMGNEFTFGDRALYIATIAWTTLWSVVFLVGTAYNAMVDVPVAAWANFWYWYTMISLIVGAGATLWLTGGGILDLKKMIHGLRVVRRDHHDDGTVPSPGLSDAVDMAPRCLPSPNPSEE